MSRHKGTVQGRCQEERCLKLRFLRIDGRMPRHPEPGPGYANTRPVCAGSLRKPQWTQVPDA